MKSSIFKILGMLITIMLIINTCFGAFSIAASLTMTISGTIALPSGLIAPIDGIEVEVFASNNGTVANYVDLLIPDGSNNISFSFTVPSLNGRGYIVGYWVVTSDSNYVDGYYSNADTTDSPTNATYINGTNGDNSNISITMFRNDVISGTISLPYGQVAPTGGIIFEMYANLQGVNVGDYPDITIAEGSKKADYSINIVTTSATTTYKVGYWVVTANTLYQDAFYNNSGTAIDISDASQITVSNGLAEGIDFYTLKSDIICADEPQVANGDGTLIDTLIGQSSVMVYTNVTNMTSSSRKVKLFLALYNSNDQLVNFTRDTVFLNPYDYSNLCDMLSLSGISTGYYIKVFLWDADSNEPLIRNIIFE